MQVKVPFGAQVSGRQVEGTLVATAAKTQNGVELRGLQARIEGKTYTPSVEAAKHILQQRGYALATGPYDVFDTARSASDIMPLLARKAVQALVPGAYQTYPRGLHFDGQAVRELTTKDTDGRSQYYYQDYVTLARRT